MPKNLHNFLYIPYNIGLHIRSYYKTKGNCATYAQFPLLIQLPLFLIFRSKVSLIDTFTSSHPYPYLPLNLTKNTNVSNIAAHSETIGAYHSASLVKMTGSSKMLVTSKPNVLKNEIIAEIIPLLSAVKNAEPQ